MAFSEGRWPDGLAKVISLSPIATGAVILFAVAVFVIFVLPRSKNPDFPVVGKPGSAYYGEAILEGVSKVGHLYIHSSLFF